MTDSFVPAKLPVPSLITRGAELISEQFKSGAFPYRMKFINLEDVVFWQAMIVILLQPLVWNVVGRMEHYTRILSKICFKPVFGVYALALWIFVAGLYRDALFVAAMRSQGTHEQLGELQYVMAGWGCIFVGSVLVLSSFYRLGLTGVYLGDYFGLLMDEKITAFPYNLLSDPMYIGSSLAFLGKAILYVHFLYQSLTPKASQHHFAKRRDSNMWPSFGLLFSCGIFFCEVRRAQRGCYYRFGCTLCINS